MQRKALTKERLPIRDTVAFSFAAMGKDACNNFVVVYYMFFLTQVLSLNAGIIGTIFATIRLVTAFSSPLIGSLVDNTTTKIGKYRPWILISSVIGAIAIGVMFNIISTNEIAQYFFYLALFVVFEFSALILDITIWAFLPTITNNIGNRNIIISVSKTSAGIGVLFAMAGTPLFLDYYFGGEYDPQGYLVISVILGIIMLIGGLLVYLFNKENVIIENDTIKLKDLFKSLFENDQLVVYFVSFLLINLATIMSSNFAIYFFAYDIGNIKLFSAFILITGFGQGIGLISYPYLASKAPVKKLLVIATSISIAGYIMMIVIIAIFGVSNIVLLIIGAILMMFCGGMVVSCTQAMLVDISDYGEYKLGNRTAGVVYSTNTMLYRVVAGVIIFFVGISLSVAGISGVDIDTGEVEEISNKGLWIIRTMMFIIPGLALVLGLLLFLFKYKLNDKEMYRIRQALNRKYTLVTLKKAKKLKLEKMRAKIVNIKKDCKKFKEKEFYCKDKALLKEKKINITNI